jgi:hypothetical protein
MVTFMQVISSYDSPLGDIICSTLWIQEPRITVVECMALDTQELYVVCL